MQTTHFSLTHSLSRFQLIGFMNSITGVMAVSLATTRQTRHDRGPWIRSMPVLNRAGIVWDDLWFNCERTYHSALSRLILHYQDSSHHTDHITGRLIPWLGISLSGLRISLALVDRFTDRVGLLALGLPCGFWAPSRPRGPIYFVTHQYSYFDLYTCAMSACRAHECLQHDITNQTIPNTIGSYAWYAVMPFYACSNASPNRL